MTRMPPPDSAKTAVVIAETGETLTHGELAAAANRYGHALRALGLGVGDGIAWCVENSPAFFTLLLASHRSGLYYTPVSTYLGPKEIAYIVRDCGARVFVLSSALSQKAQALRELLADHVELYSTGGELPGYEPLEPLADGQPATLPEASTTGQDLLYSSGTTGQPKGIKLPLPGREIDEISPAGVATMHLYRWSPEVTYLSPAPLYHAAPLRFNLLNMIVGGTSIVLRNFDPELALEALQRHRCNRSQWVPTMFVRMLKLPPEVRARYDTSSMELALHAAAPCPVATKRAMLDWWGPVIHEYYAGSENNGMCTITPQEWLAHPGSVGKPLYGEVHILDDDGNELPPGETGTVYFGGGNPFEYLNDPEKTKQAYDYRGWSTLGDVGHVDEEGYLYLTDRKAYMIISGGVNIYPQEVENLLVMHPEVADCAVFGVPDEDMGEQVKAVVQPLEAGAGTAELAGRLLDYCRAELSHVKCPRSIDFADELPRHPTGKLYKRLLKARYWETPTDL